MVDITWPKIFGDPEIISCYEDKTFPNVCKIKKKTISKNHRYVDRELTNIAGFQT